MNNPFDENWLDLAAELGVETPQPPPKVEEPPPLPEEATPVDLSATIFEATLPDASDDDPADTEVIEAGGDTEADRKRRRRRRRKKKGEPAGDAPESDVEAREVEEPVTQPRELLRDIIKNWDVPSWDEIVGGLHRPHR